MEKNFEDQDDRLYDIFLVVFFFGVIFIFDIKVLYLFGVRENDSRNNNG